MNANDILFRCSGLGNIMGESGPTEKQMQTIADLQKKASRTDIQQKELDRLLDKLNNPEMPETCVTHLIDLYISEVWGRKEDATGKFLEKGNEREEDSITLLSVNTRVFYKKNEEHLKNLHIKGTPDVFIGENIHAAEETTDTKTSWSAHSFKRAAFKPLNPLYKWQGVGYMALTGAKKHTVAYCLVNGTYSAIMDEKRKLLWKYGSEESLEYIEKCKQIEINHIFDMASFLKEYPHFDFHNNVADWNYDIPREQRLHTFSFERNEAEIEKLYKRIGECRKWMNENLFTIVKADLIAA